MAHSGQQSGHYEEFLADRWASGITTILHRNKIDMFVGYLGDFPPLVPLVVAMKPIQTSLMIVFLAAAFPLRAELSSYALAGQYACLGCHAVDFDHAGPSFQRVAERYGKISEAKAMLLKSVKEGSNEKWGTAPMPPVTVPEKDLARIIEWVLEQ